MQFQPIRNTDDTIRKFATPKIQEVIADTGNLINNLLQQLTPPETGTSVFKKYSQAAKLRFMWIKDKSEVELRIATVGKRTAILSGFLSSENNALLSKLVSKIEAQSQQNISELRDIMTVWLGALDYYAQHAAHWTCRQSGTGSWFVNGPLKSWMDLPSLSAKPPSRWNRILWVYGNSGSGKSLLASYAVESAILAAETNIWTILYFYCTFQEIKTQTVLAVLASLIHQMCEKRPDLWKRVNVAREKSVTGARDSRQGAALDQLKGLFLEFSTLFPRICIFFDAPNESLDPESILDALCEGMHVHPFMQLCLFTTPGLFIQRYLDIGLTHVPIDPEEQKADFKICINASLQNNPSLAMLSNELKQDITYTLVSKADGSFRWVDCQLQYIAEQDCVKNIREALRKLSPTLKKHYRNTLAAVEVTHRLRVRRLLRWLQRSIRPLEVQELSEAVILVSGSDSTILTDEEKVFKERIELYVKFAGSLVEYDFETQTVVLAHSSVQDYLKSIDGLNDPGLKDFAVDDHIGGAMESILNACLWYLLQEPFVSGPSDSMNSLLSSWHLFDYCA